MENERTTILIIFAVDVERRKTSIPRRTWPTFANRTPDRRWCNLTTLDRVAKKTSRKIGVVIVTIALKSDPGGH